MGVLSQVADDSFFSPLLFSPSALWVFATLLPTLMLNTEKRDVPLGTRDYIGWTMWGLGFATQAIADQQKWLFKGDPDNAVSQPTSCFATFKLH